MIPNLFPNSLLACGAAATMLLASCAYDPYYGSTSYSYSSGGYASGGYGHGYGYGGSSFTTSFLISTGDPRWGYCPYTYSYYDYTRRAYYDPYLYGYYPVGYRPPVLVGVPHPHGWRQGRPMPPPTRVRTVTLTNYQNRESAYRQSQHSWAPRVREDRRADAGPPQQRGGGASRRPETRQPASTAPSRPWDRSAGPVGSPALRPDERQRNPMTREREDSRRGVAPPPAARPGTAWQGADTGRSNPGRPESGRRAPGLPADFNQPIAVPPQAPPPPAPDFGGNRGGGRDAERGGRPQAEPMPQEPASRDSGLPWRGDGGGRGAADRPAPQADPSPQAPADWDGSRGGGNQGQGQGRGRQR
jgi:hypothetical protein